MRARWPASSTRSMRHRSWLCHASRWRRGSVSRGAHRRRSLCLTRPQLDEFLHASAAMSADARKVSTQRVLHRLRALGLIAATRRLAGGPGGGSARVVYSLTGAGQRLTSALDPSFRRHPAWIGATAFVEHRPMTADVAL